MQQYQNVLQDKFGNVIVGASVAVYVYGTTTPATIYSGNGTGLGNHGGNIGIGAVRNNTRFDPTSGFDGASGDPSECDTASLVQRVSKKRAVERQKAPVVFEDFAGPGLTEPGEQIDLGLSIRQQGLDARGAHWGAPPARAGVGTALRRRAAS